MASYTGVKQAYSCFIEENTELNGTESIRRGQTSLKANPRTRDPHADNFRNLVGTSSSKDISIVKLS